MCELNSVKVICVNVRIAIRFHFRICELHICHLPGDKAKENWNGTLELSLIHI